MTGALLSIDRCAAALEISVAQLRRDLRAGAPQARPGRKGRGGAALLDPLAIAAWRCGSQGVEAFIRGLAAELPGRIATELVAQFRNIDGPHKRATGMEFQQAWGRIRNVILARLREHVPDLPNAEVPLPIIQMCAK